MDPETNLQDVVRCHLCETPVPSLHCVICNIHLCEDCEGKHLSDKSKQHKVVPFKYRGSFPKCQIHSTNKSELFCEECKISFCELCVSRKEHQTHNTVDILKSLENRTRALQRDFQDFKTSILSKYQEIASSISEQKDDLIKNKTKLKTAIDKYGEDLNKEINTIIQKLKSDLDEMDSKHLAALNKQEEEITQTIHEIKQSIADLNKLLDSNDVSLFSAYKSRNAEFRTLPPKLTVSLPSFTPQMINKEQLYQQFGSLSTSSIKIEETGYTMNSRGAESSPLERSVIDIPEITAYIETAYGGFYNSLCNVSCVNDQDIWLCGCENIIRLYNLQNKTLKGEQVKFSIQTKSGNKPQDIAVTRSGDLVYTDYNGRTVNIVKNTQIETVIRLQGWRPLNLCCTSSGELLVVMLSDDYKQTKVVRYFGCTEKQTIQYDDKREALFSSCKQYRFFIMLQNCKFICENRNFDICVADCDANSVVVVNKAGKHRFTYNGHPRFDKESFHPHGITTDSQSRILTADHDRHCIHVLDQDGMFLFSINNCNLHYPSGLFVDTKDNLFVAEKATGIVKKIRYYV